MFLRKVDRHLLCAPHWCAIAIVLISATATDAQTDKSPANSPRFAVEEQRLYPNGLPKIELMLKAALEHHPDVLAARSKLRTAEAEQRQAEFKALKDIMEVRDRWEKAKRGAVNAGTPEEMRDRLAAVAAVEWELAFLIGRRGEPASGPQGTGEKGSVVPKAAGDPHMVVPAVVETAIPRGEQAKELKKRLALEIGVYNVVEMPMSEYVKFLSETSGLRFVLDKHTLEDEGFPADSPIIISLGELELGAALQALEDLYKPLHFVVRDYGILVTAQSERSSKNVSINDFWKLSEEELQDKVRRQREEEFKNQRGGNSGGMNGSNMF